MQLEDIKKLAILARIDMTEEEMETIAKDFDPILAYVGQVQEALNLNSAKQGSSEKLDEKKIEDYFLCNVMREDIATNTRGEYTDKIFANAPDTENGYLKVKQIL